MSDALVHALLPERAKLLAFVRTKVADPETEIDLLIAELTQKRR